MHGRLSRRWLVVATFGVVGVTALAGPAAAQSTGAGVVITSAPVQLVAAEGGTNNAGIAVVNNRATPINLRAEVASDRGCTVVANPDQIAGGRSATVKLTLDTGCAVEPGAEPIEIALAFTNTDASVAAASTTITAKTPAKPTVDWTILRYAAIAAVLLAAIGIVLIAMVVVQNKDPDLSWKRELASLGTSWSFRDSWIANVTVGGTLLAGLLGASNVLKPVLGKEPTDAIALMVVAGAIATVLVGLGPLVLKSIGTSVDVPTYGGMLLAAFVVLCGSFFQIAAVSKQVVELTESALLSGIVWAAAGIITVMVLAYAVRAFAGFVQKGVTPPAKTVPPEVQAAMIIAKAIRPETAAATEAAIMGQAATNLFAHRRSALL